MVFYLIPKSHGSQKSFLSCQIKRSRRKRLSCASMTNPWISNIRLLPTWDAAALWKPGHLASISKESFSPAKCKADSIHNLQYFILTLDQLLSRRVSGQSFYCCNLWTQNQMNKNAEGNLLPSPFQGLFQKRPCVIFCSLSVREPGISCAAYLVNSICSILITVAVLILISRLRIRLSVICPRFLYRWFIS